MKKTLLLLCLCIVVSSCAFAQTTFLADTAFTTDVGFGGAPASCIYEPHGYWFGLDISHERDWWVADFFTVPAGATWTFDTVIVFAYEWGSTTTSSFTEGYLRIYQDGPPGLGGTLIWGDSVTNILASTAFTGIYRVDTFASSGGLTGTDRPIMNLKLYLSPAPHLSAGTYWMAWSATGSGTTSPDSPPKVLPGRINPSGQNARHDSSGVWTTITDDGHTIGMNKIIIGSAAVSASVNNLTYSSLVTLGQNMPNPFTGTTDITFYMPQQGYAKLCVYNEIGQLVSTLVDGMTNAGQHHITFDGHALAPGIYTYQLTADEGVAVKQMLLAK